MHVIIPDDGHDSIGAGGAKGVATGSTAVLMGTQDKHELLLRIAGDEDEGEGEAARLQTCTIRFFLEPLTHSWRWRQTMAFYRVRVLAGRPLSCPPAPFDEMPTWQRRFPRSHRPRPGSLAYWLLLLPLSRNQWPVVTCKKAVLCF